MERRKRSARGKAPERGECAVCGLRDTRMLTVVPLRAGEEAILCGSHALLHERAGGSYATVAELRAALSDRRETNRRGRLGEGDELGEMLISAFTRDRRGADRRMN